jgi:integrase
MESTAHSPAYLVRNAHSYCFRLIVPKDIQKFVGRSELRYTLRTGYLGVAKRKSRFLAGQVQFIFQLLRKGVLGMGKLSETQIQLLVVGYIKRYIDRLDNVFDPGQNGDLPYDDPSSLASYIQLLDAVRDDLMISLNLGDYSMLEKSIDTFLKENGITEVDKSSPEYRKLCIEIHKAEYKLIPIQQKHRELDFSYKDQLSKIFPEVFPDKQVPPMPQVPQAPIPPEAPVPKKERNTLGKVMKEYWDEKEPAIKKRSRPEYKRTLDHFVKFVGENIDISEIDAPLLRGYKDRLRKEKSRDGKVRTPSTINNKYLGTVRGFFSYAERNQYIARNPAQGIRVEEGKKKKPHELRDPFTNDELKRMFCESQEYGDDQHKKASYFWLPIIALYTGMRLEEICQLYVSDVRKVGGVWGFNISEDEGKEDKSVKTGETRFVPLHPFLVQDLNFLAYVETLPDKQGRVFPGLTRVGERYGHHVSLWFKKFREGCGVVAPPRRKTFHSFRHTVINHLLDKDVSLLAVTGLVGHKIPGVTMEVYKKPLPPRKVLEDAVKKLDYGIDLSHLKNSKWVVK